jgi:hypothetical protein
MAVLRVASNGQTKATISVKVMNKLFFAIIAAMCLSLLGCEDLPESSFELATESRLPKWFTLPPGLARSDVTVMMSYYVKQSGRTSTFKLLDARKKKLAELNGTQKGMEPLKRKTPQPGFSPGYPIYEIVTVNGITEIIEHRQMESIFYITDDPTVWAEFKVNRK